jgi:hypothetical protein
MNRRLAISSSLVITAGIFLIPSCLQDRRKPTIKLRNLDIDAKQEDMLADLMETIIPKTSTPGAKDILSHEFALMMVDDCLSPDDQKQFMRGLNQFESDAKTRFGVSFINCTQEQKTTLLQSIEKKTGIPADELSFYNSTKRLGIQSFTSSQFFLTRIHVYEMVPSRFHGCVPLSKSNL